uniref:Uncharacterized protein n=1 Tax=Anguilla anguilla TaxID=7936 RepID=A0A0E9U6Z0_ANGAN
MGPPRSKIRCIPIERMGDFSWFVRLS